MPKARIFKITGGDNMRTDDMFGTYYDEPKIGEGFKLYNNKGLVYGMRYLYTSDVEEIENIHIFDTTLIVTGWVIKTATGSEYGIDKIPEKDD